MEGVLNMIGKGKKSEDVAEKLKKATDEKNEGNECFKKGDNGHAAYHYHSALMYVKGLVGLSPEETATANQIKATCNNNLAAVHLKEERWERVISCCNQVLEIEPKNTKALFRRGKAYLNINNLDKAEEDLKKAQELDPNDKAVPRELAILKRKEKEQSKKQQKFYANMFDKIKSEDIYEQKPQQEQKTVEESDAGASKDEADSMVTEPTQKSEDKSSDAVTNQS